MSWIDKLLEVGTTFDWISPMIGLAEDIIGGMDTIATDIPAGLSANDVVRTLKRHGVRVGKTPEIISGQLVMTVDDAQKAWRILRRL